MRSRTFKQTARGAFTRRILLESTTTCLVSHGYGGTTTAAICNQAGMTAGALFGQFPNKTSLLVEVADDLATQATTLVESAFLGLPHDLDEALARLFDNLMEVWRTPVIKALGELWTAARTDPAIAEALVAAESGRDAVLARLGERHFGPYDHAAMPALARVVLDAVVGRTAVEDARVAAGLPASDGGRAATRATLASLGLAVMSRGMPVASRP